MWGSCTFHNHQPSNRSIKTSVFGAVGKQIMRFHDRSHLNLQPIACRDAPEFMSSVCEKGNKDWGTCWWLVYPLFVYSVPSIADVSIYRSSDMVYSPKGHTQKTSCWKDMQPKDNARIWSKMIKIKICQNNPVYNRNTTEMLQISVRKSKTWCCHAAMACVCRPMYRSRRVTSIVPLCLRCTLIHKKVI